MIPFVIIRKIFLSIVPLVFFYFLKKIINPQKPKRKSHLPDLDKEKIVEGEIIDENSDSR
ncbi:MAG: hypothetical protein A3H17_04075 [Candidatus Levybacteria bacterium RIFCSPLOWO2_12_FULL_37_14]|nr:MAG: hypothetical protein A3H17_04075 [Candidatus Levybacteria bacterium RIFCSPLOWO2_12_FULL_37_14]